MQIEDKRLTRRRPASRVRSNAANYHVALRKYGQGTAMTPVLLRAKTSGARDS